MDKAYFAAVVDQLRDVGIGFEAGLSDAEVAATERKFGFVFPPDLRMFLQTALPVSRPAPEEGVISTWDDPFLNWRSDDDEKLWERVHWPYEGICFDIEHNGFWMEDWGVRPASIEAACVIAREKVNQAPTLIPLYADRFMPDSPSVAGNPVYSVWQTDIIYYGFDLADYLVNQFDIEPLLPEPIKPRRVEFWASLPGMWNVAWDE